MRKALIVLLAIIQMFFLFGCRGKEVLEEKRYTKSGFLMDTYVEINIYSNDEEKAISALEDAFQEIRLIESLMSAHLEDSEVSRINKKAGIEPVEVDDRTLAVIQRGVYFGDITDGLFDITIGSLTKTWSINANNPVIPTREKIEKQLKYVDYKQVEIIGNSVMLANPNSQIDLGGIAKGYGADRAAEILKAAGITRGIVNLGGDIVVIGAKNEESGWNIGIQHPRDAKNVLIATVEVIDTTIVSSGDYERFFIKDGIRYHHIFDPRTGYPADSDLISVTIITDSAMDGDGFSTALFVMGSEKAIDFIENTKGLEGVLITEDLNILISSGLEGKVKLR